jgi:predicted XRE-type DNA-binding protein
MTFPSREEIERVSKKLRDVEGTILPPENPTPIEKLRWEICQKFVVYKLDNKVTQKELAALIGVDEAKISKILRHRIEEFTTDRLVKLFYKIDKNFSLKIIDAA